MRLSHISKKSFLLLFLLITQQVEDVELLDKRGYLTVSLNLGKDGRVLLRYKRNQLALTFLYSSHTANKLSFSKRE